MAPARPSSRSRRWIVLLAVVSVLAVGSNLFMTWRQLSLVGGGRSPDRAAVASPAAATNYQYLLSLVQGLADADKAALLSRNASASNLRTDQPEAAAADGRLPLEAAADGDLASADGSLPSEVAAASAAADADGSFPSASSTARESAASADAAGSLPSAADPLAAALDALVQRTSSPRGVVIPLSDATASAGVALILDLRARSASPPSSPAFPVEVPHCGDDLSARTRSALLSTASLRPLRFYDACALAAESRSPDGSPLFCSGADACRLRFGSGADLRALALVFSRFDEVLLLEPNVLFFRSPLDLWAREPVRGAGVLLFHDRITQPGASLSAAVRSSQTNRPTTALAEFLSATSAAFLPRFSSLPTPQRPPPTANSSATAGLSFPYAPSDFLLASHAISGRTGHQVDAAVVLWAKSRQRRATALLAAFLTREQGVQRPPSHSDKELFFLALELAEARFSFSHYAIGAIGSDFRDFGPAKSVVCGSAAHYWPARDGPGDAAASGALFFATSANFLSFRPVDRTVFYSQARPASDFPGDFEARGLHHGCPFDITGLRLDEHEMNVVAYRQLIHTIAQTWTAIAATQDGAVLPTDALLPLLSRLQAGELLITAAEEQAARERRHRDSDRELVLTLHTMAQAAIDAEGPSRGIVLPLFDKIAPLGLSLLLELRALGVRLPVEVPMCGGDVSASVQALVRAQTQQFGAVRFYDACVLAANATSLTDDKRHVFCEDLAACQRRFRSFDIKLLGVFFSRFAEVLLLDADTIFFQSPLPLFETAKYRQTGTLFFNDRIVHNDMYLAAQVDGQPEGKTRLREYLSSFNVGLFRDVPTLSRGPPTVPNAVSSELAPLKFQPSDVLLGGHPWNKRSGHQMDSSCVLWDKKRQPRATAVLLAFIALNSVRRPPSYGDKELFHVACEVAETRYAFSDFGIGAVGTEVHDHGDDKSRVCGSMAQYYPESDGPRGRTPLRGGGSLLYLNSDHILAYAPEKRAVYYTKARPAELYPGEMPDKRYDCPWNVTAVKLADSHAAQIRLRQQMHAVVTSWSTVTANQNLTRAVRTKQTRALAKTLDGVFLRVQALQTSVDELVDQETHLALSLGNLTQRVVTRGRGIVIPMYERITLLGLSLVLELRAMGIDLPVEVPHCGDIDVDVQQTFEAYKPLGDVRFYDACQLAVGEKSVVDGSTKLFCEDLADCHRKFRGFEVKILAVALSQFADLVLMDADTIFFADPAALMDSDKFVETGTLFFHDRASHEVYYMAERLRDGSDNTIYHDYMSRFDVGPFRSIPTLERPKATVENPVDLPLDFEPSDFLLRSNVWNKRTGHQMDSSLVLWSKQRQPRATAILASFITTGAGGVKRPPSYGDKEFFFTACELAEARYSFSDFGIGGFGSDFTDNGLLNSTVCGVMSQLYPIKPADPTVEVGLMHVNSDFILTYTPKDPDKPLYYSRGRPAEFYPGAFGERRMECPFEITGARLTVEEEDHILLRQQLGKDLEAWQRDVGAAGGVAGVQAAAEVKARVQAMEQMETQLVHSLNQLSQRATAPRGLVLPLHDGIASLGASLVMELRAMGVSLPVEVPHCGDLSAERVDDWRGNHSARLGDLRVYDVCAKAAKAVGSFDPTRKLFCKDERDCQRKFRGFDVKVLALVFSQFEEVLLLDADTIFFSNPTLLFETSKYRDTGVLLFPDRISQPDGYLGGLVRAADGRQVPAIHAYLSTADVALYRSLHVVERAPATVESLVDVALPFQPSDWLLSSHAWNGRAGHAVDSSCVLWDKKRQPRATAILAAFVALNDLPRPPSYGDKELFFMACELAETRYSVADYGVGGVGTDFRDAGENNSTICGDAAHYWPEKRDDAKGGSLLYLNSDNLLTLGADTRPVFYSQARPAEVYPGPFSERELPQDCPFDVTGVPLEMDHRTRLALRQEFYRTAEGWAAGDAA